MIKILEKESLLGLAYFGINLHDLRCKFCKIISKFFNLTQKYGISLFNISLLSLEHLELFLNMLYEDSVDFLLLELSFDDLAFDLVKPFIKRLNVLLLWSLHVQVGQWMIRFLQVKFNLL